LVLVKDILPITDRNNNVSFQIGRSLVNVFVKCKWKFAMKMNETNEKIQDNYDPMVPKAFLQFKYDHVTDDENIIEIADSDEESDSDDDDEEEEPEQNGAEGQQEPGEEVGANLIEGEESVDVDVNGEIIEIVNVNNVEGGVEGENAIPVNPVNPHPHEDCGTDESFSSHSNDEEA